jgi:uncharacterized protein
MMPRPFAAVLPLLFATLAAVLALPGFPALAQQGDATAPPAAAAPGGHQRQRANHLTGETSPYLLLHVHNPVDWHPWGPEAFAKAKAEGKPVFLSIGYSSCHWCHVMERESFSDEEIAAYLNEHFVAIKVDREERPDIDDIYMTALQVYYQAVGSPQGGGWPMSMFLTPEGKPMLGGTYFPPRDRQGRPGFLNVLKQVHSIWTDHHDEIVGHADIIAGEVRRIMQPAPGESIVPLDRSLVTAAVEALKNEYDPEYGGVDFDPQQPVGPKFPVPSRLMLLQSQIASAATQTKSISDATDPPLTVTSNKAAEDDAAESVTTLQMLDHTLEQMARGGIFDHLGGGFHRYSTDRRWLVPHFEKMLYDNAQLAEVYAQAYRRTNRKLYRDIAERTFEFVLRDLTDSEGGFYSALDAQTDGIEGKFYVWSPEQVVETLGEQDAELFKQVYGLTQPEFFEHGYVLHLSQPLETTAGQLDLPAEELRQRLAAAREKLLKVRNQRPALLKDDKILTSWNGLMIRALAVGGDALGREDLIAAARKGALFVLASLRDEEGRLLRTHREGESKLNAYLDDYAFLVDGLLALHKVTGETEWLNAARRLTDDQIAMFWDDEGHGFFFTPDHHEELLARTRNAYDSVIPSGNAVAVRNLVRLAQLTGEVSYRDRATQTLQVFAANLQERPTGLTFMALALDEYLTAFGDAPPAETVASRSDEGTPQVAQAGRPGPATRGNEEPLIVAGRTNPRDKEAKVAAKIYLSVDRLPPGGEAEVAILLEIQDGWHINTNPASDDFLIPTEITAKSEGKLELKDIRYPKGHPFRMAGFDDPITVYEGEVLFKGKIVAPRSAAGRTEKLDVEIGYQSCNDKTCLRPTQASVTLQIPVAPAGQAGKPINQRLFRKQPAQK